MTARRARQRFALMILKKRLAVNFIVIIGTHFDEYSMGHLRAASSMSPLGPGPGASPLHTMLPLHAAALAMLLSSIRQLHTLALRFAASLYCCLSHCLLPQAAFS